MGVDVICGRREQQKKLLYFFFFSLRMAVNIASICWFGGGSGTVVVFFSNCCCCCFLSSSFLSRSLALSCSIRQIKFIYLLVVSFLIRDFALYSLLCVCRFKRLYTITCTHSLARSFVHSIAGISIHTNKQTQMHTYSCGLPPHSHTHTTHNQQNDRTISFRFYAFLCRAFFF